VPIQHGHVVLGVVRVRLELAVDQQRLQSGVDSLGRKLIRVTGRVAQRNVVPLRRTNADGDANQIGDKRIERVRLDVDGIATRRAHAPHQPR
jgi:hypothetical protein